MAINMIKNTYGNDTNDQMSTNKWKQEYKTKNRLGEVALEVGCPVVLLRGHSELGLPESTPPFPHVTLPGSIQDPGHSFFPTDNHGMPVHNKPVRAANRNLMGAAIDKVCE